MRIDRLGRDVRILIGFLIDQLEITAVDLAFFVCLSRSLSTASARMKRGRMRGRAFTVAIVAARRSKRTGTPGPKKARTETSDKSFEWR